MIERIVSHLWIFLLNNVKNIQKTLYQNIKKKYLSAKIFVSAGYHVPPDQINSFIMNCTGTHGFPESIRHAYLIVTRY
jgi:hypothetical protein